ncbi:hypothetical protein LCGC14_1228890 [marine sediment metagenome]|uniref:Uncharacterized protein n=1 Tax=marine sediment metagenome TaxID=412755 RepID=A0A0F9PDH1_9ZZZZ
MLLHTKDFKKKSFRVTFKNKLDKFKNKLDKFKNKLEKLLTMLLV